MTIAIIGVGLIGGSIGMALKGCGHHILGYDPSSEHLEKALSRYCIDEKATLEQCGAADAVFVAVPPSSVLGVLRELAPYIKPGTAITDCTSVKSALMKAMKDEPEPLASQFIGGHPMAGHEKSGPGYASEWMFRGARWIITPTKRTTADVKDRISGLIKEMGAKPIRIDAAEHDRHVAVLSHLPHVLAAALYRMGEDLERPEVSAGSWRDVTRVAGVDPVLWTQILHENREQTSLAIDDLVLKLQALRATLDDPTCLRAELDHIARLREKESRTNSAEDEGATRETLSRSASRSRSRKR